MKMPDTARFTDINALITRIERMTEQDGKDFAEKVDKALRRNRKGVHENMPPKDMDADIYSAADKMYRKITTKKMKSLSRTASKTKLTAIVSPMRCWRMPIIAGWLSWYTPPTRTASSAKLASTGSTLPG